MDHAMIQGLLYCIRSVECEVSTLRLALVRKGLIKEADLKSAHEILKPHFAAVADAHAKIGEITPAQLEEVCGRIEAAADLVIEKIDNAPGPAPEKHGGRLGRRKRRK